MNTFTLLKKLNAYQNLNNGQNWICFYSCGILGAKRFSRTGKRAITYGYSWVTLDSWVKPYSIRVLAIKNMMKESSLHITAGSSEIFMTLCTLECKPRVSALSNPMDGW